MKFTLGMLLLACVVAFCCGLCALGIDPPGNPTPVPTGATP